MELKRIEVTCPGCQTDGIYSFCELRDVPVDVGRVEDSPELALRVPRGDIVLCYCEHCGLVHNIEFDPSNVSFEPGYEVALHHSTVFRDFIHGVAERLIDKYDLHGQRILDIGCGGGYFLETLCQLGGNHGVGIDPTVSRPGKFPAGDGSVTFVRDFWSVDHANVIGDFITCQSVFEDIRAPLVFLQELKGMLQDRAVPVYFEVFNGYRAFEQGETWSIHYEECNYFNLACLRRIFELAGFEVTEADYCYKNDQYLYVEAIPNSRTESNSLEAASIPPAIRDFSQLHARCIDDWTRRLREWQTQNRSVVLWGSGGKGVNFLNSVAASDVISSVVDINPDRQGKYVPGSGQGIVPPNFLQNHPPDVVILTNPIYKEEVAKQMNELGIDCELTIA